MLDLGFNCIGDTGCGYLALHCIAGNTNLHSLCLAGNQIGPEGATAIATGIIHGTVLRNLHLSANKIGPNGIKALSGAIAKNEAHINQMVTNGNVDVNTVRPMEGLHLGSTAMTSDGFSAISVMVLLNSSLRSMSLCNNNLDDQDMLLLSEALNQNNKKIPLEILHLSFNHITCQGAECFTNAVWGSATLREIKLDNNRIKDRGVQLCAVLLTSIDLHTIDLSFNKASTIGIKALMKTLTDNSSLKSLAISGIPIDQTASKAISYALAYNNTLNSLYLDNCSTGYASQRHIVAGAVSNSKSSLRMLTGFGISREYQFLHSYLKFCVFTNNIFCVIEIAMTLGMPWLPETWTNDQLLGFFHYMWQIWLQKSSSNTEANLQRGPAPPAAVAAASKIAFSSLGPDAATMFRTEDHNKPLKEGAPVEPAESAFLERTDSGTLSAPSSMVSIEKEISEIDLWASKSSVSNNTVSSSRAATRILLNDPERRKLNVRWLRHHFRSLSDIGRLPVHNADLWQLHQYFFSPPFHDTDENVGARSDAPSNVASDLPLHSKEDTFRPENLALLMTFTDALTDDFDTTSAQGTKRATPVDADQRENGPATKKAKSVKPRIAYYPRVMVRDETIISSCQYLFEAHSLFFLRRDFSHLEPNQLNRPCRCFDN